MADDTTTQESLQLELKAPPSDILETESFEGEELALSADFDDWNLDANLRKALDGMGYERPMPVQVAVFNILTQGHDLMVQSKTGSGKTAAFGIPIAQLLANGNKGVQALILAPTRELALQVAKEIDQLVEHMDVSVCPVYGGAPINPQIAKLKAGAQIVAGTPGRVLDHIRRRTLDTSGIRMLILDECDEMLSMGFQEEIENIISTLPAKENRQTLLFSATIPKEIERIGRRHMRDPEMLSLSSDSVGAELIDHYYYVVTGMARTRDLLKLMKAERPESAIIFCNTREETNVVSRYLQRHGYDAEALSSDLSQADRERVMGRMRDKSLNFLVATDIAARGIDISELSHVINYTFPSSPEVYVHRTGRTGRAGKQGTALSLVGPREIGAFYYLKLIYKIIPAERELPTADEMATIEEGEQYLKIVEMLDGKPRSEYFGLARRLWQSTEGERVVALLLEKLMTAKQAPVLSKPVATSKPVAASERLAVTERVAASERVAEVSTPVERPVRTASRIEAAPLQSEAIPSNDQEEEEQPKRKRRRRRRSEELPEQDRVEAEETEEIAPAEPVAAAPLPLPLPPPPTPLPANDTPAPEEIAAKVEPSLAEEEAVAVLADEPAESDEPALVDEPAEPEVAATSERPRRKRRRRGSEEKDEPSLAASPVAEEAPEQKVAPVATEEAPRTVAKARVAKTPAAKASKRRTRKPVVEPGVHVEFWEAWAETKTVDPAVEEDETDEAQEDVEVAAESEIDGAKKKRRRRRGGKSRKSESDEVEASDAVDEDREAVDAASEDDDDADDVAASANGESEKAKAVDAEPSDPDSVRLFVNVGKREDADADEIKAFLAEALGDKAEGLGRLTLRNTHCYIRVKNEIADDVIEACTGLVFKEREMVVERAKR